MGGGSRQPGSLSHRDHPYMELHCNLSRLEQEAQTRLASSDTLTPEETAYYGALVDYAMECRPLLNHGEPLPEPPKLTDFDQSLQDYKAQVEAEIAQEAADAGMTWRNMRRLAMKPRPSRRRPKSRPSRKPRNNRRKSLRRPTTTIPSMRARPAVPRK